MRSFWVLFLRALSNQPGGDARLEAQQQAFGTFVCEFVAAASSPHPSQPRLDVCRTAVIALAAPDSRSAAHSLQLPQAGSGALQPNKSLERTCPQLGAIENWYPLASFTELERTGHRARPLSSRSLGGCASSQFSSNPASPIRSRSCQAIW